MKANYLKALQSLKKEVDEQILKNSSILENESFVEKMMVRFVIGQLKDKHHLDLDPQTAKNINTLIVKDIYRTNITEE